jgi:hypothetical protein
MRSLKTGTLTVYKPAGIFEKIYEPLAAVGVVQVRFGLPTQVSVTGAPPTTPSPASYCPIPLVSMYTYPEKLEEMEIVAFRLVVVEPLGGGVVEAVEVVVPPVLVAVVEAVEVVVAPVLAGPCSEATNNRSKAIALVMAEEVSAVAVLAVVVATVVLDGVAVVVDDFAGDEVLAGGELGTTGAGCGLATVPPEGATGGAGADAAREFATMASTSEISD